MLICDFTDSLITLYKSGMAFLDMHFLVGSSYLGSSFLTRVLKPSFSTIRIGNIFSDAISHAICQPSTLSIYWIHESTYWFSQKNPSLTAVLIAFHHLAMLLHFVWLFQWLLSTVNTLPYGVHKDGKKGLKYYYRQYGLALVTNLFL